MFKIFSKGYLSALFALVSLNAMNASLMAWEECCDSPMEWDCCESTACDRLYIGAFAGEIYSDSTKVSQMGTAFFTEAEGGPLAVFAQGHTKKKSSGFGGVQFGYEWSPRYFGCSNWTFAPAAELEAYFFSNKKKGHLINPTERLPEHDFLDSFHMNMRVCLVNAVFSLNNTCWCGFSPYIGVGIGATRNSIRNAKSLQLAPPEVGIDHFNSRRSDTCWTFAAQAKFGLRYAICKSFHIFGEYRYLFVDSSNYIFGSTVYPTHAPTSPWNVKVHNTHYNAFSIGIQYDI